MEQSELSMKNLLFISKYLKLNLQELKEFSAGLFQ